MTIVSVEAFPIRLRRDRDQSLGTAGSPTPLAAGGADYRWSERVAALYSLHFETALVRLTTDTGLTGWGEAQAPLAPEVACTIVDRLLRPVIEGADCPASPDEIASLWDRMYATMRVRGQTGGFMLDAISGVDLALWDLVGKRNGCPVSRLIGGGREAAPAYVSGLRGGDIAGRLAQAREHVEAGFRKIKLFFDGAPEELFATMDALRQSFGEGLGIAVDALWRLTPDLAVAFGRELDRRQALWLEAPLPPEDARAHGVLARQIRTPLALGESYRSTYELEPFFREGAIGIVQPDLGRCGITGALRIAALARAHATPVVPHVSVALGPQIAAAVHFAAAVPCDLLEYNPSVFEMANQFLETPLRFAGAAYRVPGGPGLGAEVRCGGLLAGAPPRCRGRLL